MKLPKTSLFTKFLFFPIVINITDGGLLKNTEVDNLPNDVWMHPHRSSVIISNRQKRESHPEDSTSYWKTRGQSILQEQLGKSPNKNKAKNVILFVGDGMSIATLKASRIYNGQLKGETGLEQEQETLSFEEFPHVGLSKTFCTDVLVPDSACTATAYLCGIKSREGTIGVSGSVYRGDCPASEVEENQVSSIARWSQLNNKRTGLVTTTRVTHASPAGLYAQISERNWEYDANGTNCKDIAHQLIHGETGKNLNVIMGGGRGAFIPTTLLDEEVVKGKRTDDLNLIEAWLKDKESEDGKYIWNRNELLNLDDDTKYVLGLFESDHMKYNLEDDKDEPRLEEMTEAAIKMLDNDEGYFLFVEGGRIDHAHHDNRAHKALDETVEFSKAIQKARDMTSEVETLIVVTSDHAHVMTVNGYPLIGADILGLADTADDGYPYTILSYSNGPGYKENVDGHRYDVSNDDTHDVNYAFSSLAYRESESHGGEDVGIFASGPWSHLFTGVIKQHAIPHLMAYASCVGDGITSCESDQSFDEASGASRKERWGWYRLFIFYEMYSFL